MGRPSEVFRAALERLRHAGAPPADRVPDRVAIWPMGDGRFGIDATFQAVTGFQRAEVHAQALRERDVRCDFRQELDGGWTIRLGPLPRPLVEQAVRLFTGSR